MDIKEADGKMRHVEGAEAEAAFRADPGPCKLNVPRSTRQFGVQRHRGEGIEAMMNRLQGRRWI
jgi:hypothetical protein